MNPKSEKWIRRSLKAAWLCIAASGFAHAATTVICTASPTVFVSGLGTQTISCPSIDAGAGNTIGNLQLLLASDYENGPTGATSGTQVNVAYMPSANFSNHTETILGGFSSTSSMTDATLNVPPAPFLAETISLTSRTLPTFTFSVTSSVLTGGPVASSTANVFLVFTPVPEVVTLTCSAVTSGEVGKAFSSLAIGVSGGTLPYTFSVATGTLPAGLTLNTSTGAITGTPTAPGSFTIKVTDGIGAVGTTTCPFTIIPGPSLTCPVVSSFPVNVAVNSPAITVSGGVSSYTFSVASGTIPSGLTLNTSTGAITGTPTALGTFSIQVTDSNGIVSAPPPCPFSVTTTPLTPTCPAASSFTVGVAVNSPAISTTGGVAPYTFSVATGTLPNGLTLNPSTGAITGTPTVLASLTIFTIKVTDSEVPPVVAVTTCPFIVSDPPLSVTCPAASSFTIGQSVNSPAIAVTGGLGPYTFSIGSGTLPNGLFLNPSTGAITGTPTATGSFTIKVTDSETPPVVATTLCPFTVSPGGPSLTCSTTNVGLINVPFNSPPMIVTGGTAPYTFSVFSGSLPPGLTLDTSTGAITGTPTATGSFTIGVTDAQGLVSVGNCAFAIVASLPGICAASAYQVRYASNLNNGESYIDITNTGANGAPLLGPGFGNAVGNICVNVYAVDPNEELISCCSCLVTPDQTVHLGVVANLTSQTLTGVVPTAVTVKLLATLAGAGGASTSCANSAAVVATATPACGLAAWGTTLHPSAGGLATTETPFTNGTLSTGELASLGGRCTSIAGNGSGFGICSACRAGALGAQKF